MTLVRLQKWLSATGACSRRQGETFISSGRVRVNGTVVTTLGTKIDPQKDLVELDGRRLGLRPGFIYIALHKPRGVVTSCRHAGEKVVIDLVELPERVYPVGRLDKDSTGLLLLTNDGRLHHHLSHPSYDHEKEYLVTVDRRIEDSALQRLADGVPIDGTRTRPARVERTGAERFRIVLQEGRNRQIRKMARVLGYQVVALKRIRVANIHLGRLAPGAWRHLTGVEKKSLLADLDKRSDPGAVPPTVGEKPHRPKRYQRRRPAESTSPRRDRE